MENIVSISDKLKEYSKLLVEDVNANSGKLIGVAKAPIGDEIQLDGYVWDTLHVNYKERLEKLNIGINIILPLASIRMFDSGDFSYISVHSNDLVESFLQNLERLYNTSEPSSKYYDTYYNPVTGMTISTMPNPSYYGLNSNSGNFKNSKNAGLRQQLKDQHVKEYQQPVYNWRLAGDGNLPSPDVLEKWFTDVLDFSKDDSTNTTDNSSNVII